MIDIHAHILPGLDDGAANMYTSLEMAALAVESGVEVIVATPHSVEPGREKNYWSPKLAQAIRDFRRELERAGIPLIVAPGMEILGTPEVPGLLAERRLIGLNDSRYPLIEFAFFDFASESTEILEEILAQGMRPVVAHPERYRYVQEDPRLLNLWVEMGCLLQVNKGSLLGRFGRREQRLALELVDRGFAHVVASDAHSHDRRTTWMGEVREVLREEFSPETAERLLEGHPLALLRDEELDCDEPEWFR